MQAVAFPSGSRLKLLYERPVSSQQSPAELITEASDRALRIGIGHSRPSGLYFSARQLQPREERRPKPNIQY